MGSNGGGSGIGSGGYQDTSDSSTRSTISSGKTEINSGLQDILTNDINQKDTDTINARKESILKSINDKYKGSFDLSTGGSYSKHTYVDGMSDVDILVNLGIYSDSDIPNKEDSKKVLLNVAKRLQDRYPGTEIEIGKMAITIKFKDGIEIQVLPAFQYKSGYKIPDPDSNGWIETYPERFKEKLTSVNQKNGGNVKPVIKLTKYLMDKNDVPIKSYHLENIALETFKDYKGPYNYADMTLYLLRNAKNKALKKIDDPSGQSDYVDDYLGDNNSEKRINLASKIARIEKKLESAQTKDDWMKIFNGR